MTKNAKYILEIINDSENHLTAEQIFLLLKEKNKKKARSVSRILDDRLDREINSIKEMLELLGNGVD